jgi:hypothetical protein
MSRQDVDRPYVPVDPPTLMDGRSAISWALLRVKLWAAVTPLILVMPPLLYAVGGLPIGGLVGFLFGVYLTAWLGASLYVISRQTEATKAEASKGYTTMFDRYYAYWQLDAVTGEVLRRPGEQTLRQPVERARGSRLVLIWLLLVPVLGLLVGIAIWTGLVPRL